MDFVVLFEIRDTRTVLPRSVTADLQRSCYSWTGTDRPSNSVGNQNSLVSSCHLGFLNLESPLFSKTHASECPRTRLKVLPGNFVLFARKFDYVYLANANFKCSVTVTPWVSRCNNLHVVRPGSIVFATYRNFIWSKYYRANGYILQDFFQNLFYLLSN